MGSRAAVFIDCPVDIPDIPPFDSKLTQRSEREISEAVQECAKLCLEHKSPQQCAREYIAKLMATGWSGDDAREVLTGAIGVVMRLTESQRAE
jgi:hypothetical protein